VSYLAAIFAEEFCMGVPGFFSKIIESWNRSDRETDALDERHSHVLKLGLFLAAAIVLAFVFIPVFIQQMRNWHNYAPEFAIHKGDWKVLVTPNLNCAEGDKGNCPASPENPVLWQSPLTRADRMHAQRTKNLRGKDFWVGVRVESALLKKAAAELANHLVLGRFNARYEVWIDGEFITGGEGRGEAAPFVMPLTTTRMKSGRPLFVAVHLFHSYGHFVPDLLNTNAGGEGLISRYSANVFYGVMSFWSFTRPAAFFSAYFLLSLLFLYIWFSAKRDQEYFYGALYLLISSFIQLRTLDVIDITKNLDLHFQLGFILEAYKGFFGLLLGMSFARTRQKIFQWIVPAFLLLPILCVFLFTDAMETYKYHDLVRMWATPSLHLFGAILCFIQALHLGQQGQRGNYLPVRIKRLWLFGGVLSVMAVFYFFYAYTMVIAPSTSQLLSLWLGAEHFFLVLFLGHLAASEIRHKSVLSHRTPISEYHQLDPMPTSVQGILLVLDLKSSEVFFKHRASREGSTSMVSVWRSHIYTLAWQYGGIVVYKKGDEVAILFDSAKHSRPLMNAVNALKEMTQESDLLERQFQGKGQMPANAIGCRFRAAMVKAELRPVWEQIGETREPSWEPAAQGHAFDDIEELFKFEKSADKTGRQTMAVIPAELMTELQSGETSAIHPIAELSNSSLKVFIPGIPEGAAA